MKKKKEITNWNDMLSILPDEILDILNKCKSVPQRSDYHPEAPDDAVPHNVYAHIKIVFERSLETHDINFLLISIFHDLGKLLITKLNDKGFYSSSGHEMVSVRFVEKWKDWIKEQGADYDVVHFVTKNHMKMRILHQMKRHKREAFMAEKYYPEVKQFSVYDEMLNPKYGTFRK